MGAAEARAAAEVVEPVAARPLAEAAGAGAPAPVVAEARLSGVAVPLAEPPAAPARWAGRWAASQASRDVPGGPGALGELPPSVPW